MAAEKTFRPAPWQVALAGIAACLFTAGFIYSFSNGASWWQVLAFGVTSPIGAVGFVSTVLTRVEIRGEQLVIRDGFATRTFDRSGLTEVSWEKGVNVSVKLASGEWAHLPGVAVGSQSLANSLRSWIDKGGRHGAV